jgi:hypothetical protein
VEKGRGTLNFKEKSLNLESKTKNVNEASRKLNVCTEACDGSSEDVFSQLNLKKILAENNVKWQVKSFTTLKNAKHIRRR